MRDLWNRILAQNGQYLLAIVVVVAIVLLLLWVYIV